MNILKLLKNPARSNLFFSPRKCFHMKYLFKSYKINQIIYQTTFSFKNSKQKSQEFDDLVGKQNETIVEKSISEENLFEPKERLVFVDSLCKIYENDAYYSSRNILLGISIFLCYLIYKISKRLKRSVENRKIFRSIFFVILIFACVSFLRSIKTFSTIMKNIDLCEDGKHIILSYPKFVVLVKKKKVDISLIQRPLKVDETSQEWMAYGYPILVENKFFSLSRSGIIHNKELLPVILNGKYINTQNKF